MGAWSTSILGNDTSADVYEYFKRMYNYQEGCDYKWSVQEITNSLYTYYYETVKDLPSEKTGFYFALALALWERGELSPAVKKIVHDLIYNKTDLDAWKELEADEKTLKSRWAATTKFYEKIKTRNPAPKKRVLQSKKVSVYVYGDCLAFQYRGYYYGLIVADDGRNTDDGSNYFLFTDIKKKTVPVLKDFEESRFISNEDLVNYLLNINSKKRAFPPEAFFFCFRKGAIAKISKSFLNTGRLPFIRTFFESELIRFSSFTSKHKTVDEMTAQALEFWSKQQWVVSEYKPSFDCAKKLDSKKIKAGILKTGIVEIPFSNILVKFRNGLWHIDATFFVKGVNKKDLQRSWVYFAQLFQHLTGREVNNLVLAQKQSADMEPLNKVDIKKFKLKHVEDQAII